MVYITNKCTVASPIKQLDVFTNILTHTFSTPLKITQNVFLRNFDAYAM